jgi:hypothetical protein
MIDNILGEKLMKSLFFLSLIGIFATPSFAAESYKWVDEEGNVQYSQMPPPKTAEEVQKVELAPAPEPTEQPAVKNAEQPAEADPNSTSSPATAAEEMQAIKKKNCETARGEIEKLNTPNAQIMTEDKENPGKFVPLSEEARKQHGEKAQAYLDAFCQE